MPTYAYTCTDCGHAFDIHQSFSDEALTVCPECSGKLRKVFSPVGVVFKGSGFYRNDARAGGKGGRTTKQPVSAGASAGGSAASAGSDAGSSPSSTGTSTTTPSSGGSSGGGTSTASTSSTAKAASA
ncbi:MAG: FmdB family transcriptional regulator [Cellulomonas sp. 73-145]|mgnify:CR=1 FL=1|uniref:FmdB family zinc ribbon protein n=1 Tax=Cellulomonas sp. 73-145 TaxID=1895739 RepID=UPI0009275649|nr:FmdB family zinc ribbon protein [Cellulomonas sp. 73-145]MBN9327029.1 FmdB family transcriptional regulator [Cellulomonas sp.]OJV56992.1 MAG: FmdB family transcriptional regulator [Cellulomonas sp. 73-145]